MTNSQTSTPAEPIFAGVNLFISMLYIPGNIKIDLSWRIKKGIGNILEDFSRSTVSLFLYSSEKNRWPIPCKANDKGMVTAELPETLEDGVYSLDLVWLKNDKSLGETRCVQYTQKKCLFSIDHALVVSPLQEGQPARLEVETVAASYGYDGLSAYEIAVLRGATTLDEVEWSKGLFNDILANTLKQLESKVRPSDGINITDKGISVKLATGLAFDDMGAVRVKMGQSLTSDDYGQVQVKTGKGIRLWTDPDQNHQVGDVRINIDPTKDGLEFADDTRLAVKVGKGIEKTNEGIVIKLATGLAFDDRGAVRVKTGQSLTFNEQGNIEVKTGKGLVASDEGLGVKPGKGVYVSAEGVNVSADNKTITVDATDGKVKLMDAVVSKIDNPVERLKLSKGLAKDAEGLSVKLATGLEFDDIGAVTVTDQTGNVKLSHGLEKNNEGIAIKLATGLAFDDEGAVFTTPGQTESVKLSFGLSKTSEGIAVKLATGLAFDDAGAIITTDQTNNIKTFNGLAKDDKGISVKLSTGLEFDDAGAIVATSGKATTENVTVTEKIPVAGGPLSQLLNDAGITEVDADTNLQDLFVSLFAKEIWPVATYRGGSITASISVPSFSVSPTAYAEIGAAVSIGAMKATATTTTTTDDVVSGLAYGYSLADDNTVDSKDTSIRSAATNIRPGSGTYLLTRVINGVSEESEDSDYANVSLPATTMTVKSGVNTIKVDIQGRGGACSYAAIDPVYICSNFGNTSEEHKYAGRAAITTLLSNIPSDSRTVTVRGVYPYFTNAASNETFDKQPLTDNRWIPANGASISSAGLTFADEGPNKHAIKIPAIYELKSVKILNPNTGKFDDYAVSNFTETTESIDVQGQSVEYKVYTRNNNGFTGSTTFKFEF